MTTKKTVFLSYSEKDADIAREVIRYLETPLLTVADAQSVTKNVTYRKVNDWEEKKLLCIPRISGKVGWRKFTAISALQLCIVSELRQIGLPTKQIKNIVTKLEDDTTFISFNKNVKHATSKKDALWRSIITYIRKGIKLLLIIDNNANVYICSELDFVRWHSEFTIQSNSPLLVIPIFSYINQIASTYRRKITLDSNTSSASLLLSDREQKMLDIIRNKQYEEIRLTKSNNDTITVTATSRKSGKHSDDAIVRAIHEKDYQNVKAVTNNGEVVALIQEERFKI